MKSFLRAAAATGVAAATVITGLSFGPAAIATPTTASHQAGDPGASFQLISKTSSGYDYVDATGNFYVKSAATLAEAKSKASTITAKYALEADGQTWWWLWTSDYCLRSMSTALPVKGIGFVNLTSNTGSECKSTNRGALWTLDNGLLRSRETDSGDFHGPRYVSGTVVRDQYRAALRTEEALPKNSFVELPTTLELLSADVRDTDLHAKTAKLADGVVQDEATSVKVSYTDNTNNPREFTAAAAGGKWEQELDKLKLGTNKVTLESFNGSEKLADNTIDVDLVVPAVKVEQANRYVKDGATKYAYQVSGGVKGASLQGKAANASNWDTLGTIGSDGSAYIADTDKGVTSGDYQLREVLESTPSATTTIAQSAIVKDQLPKVQIISATKSTAGGKDSFSYEIKGVPGAKVQDGPTSGAWADLGTIPESGVLKVYSSPRGPSGAASWDFRQTAGTTTSAKVTLAASDYKAASLGANVVSVDVEAGTAMLDGFAPGNTTAVDITYKDKDGKTQSPSARPADGVWTRSLSNLALGTTRVTLEAFNGSDLIAETTIEVDLPVVPLTATGSFAADNATNATITGTATPNTRVNAFHGESAKPVATTMSDERGDYTLSVNAPNMPGTYDLTVSQEIRGEQTSRHDVELDYGTGVSITSPSGPEDVPEDDVLVIRGNAEKDADVVVTEKGKPEDVLGSITAGDNGTYRVEIDSLKDREYTLVVSARSKGNNVTTAELVVNPGKSDVAPLVIQTPADGQTVESSSKRVSFSGTAQPFSHVKISTQTNPARTIVDTTADEDGNWTGAGDLNYDIDYTLDTTYAVEGQPVVRGEHHVRVVQANTTAPSTVISPAEGATVDAPTKQVELSGTAPTGTKVTIWNWSGKDRVVAPVVTADGDGKWSTIATLNNQNTEYALHVEYARAGAPTSTQTRNITVVNSDAVTKPFQITTPGQNDTVLAPDKRVTITGEATTGTKVTIWNYHTKDRVIGTATADKNGNWSIEGELNNQNTTYALHVEYTSPGAPTQTTTLDITVTATANTEKPFEITSPANGSTSSGHTPGQPARITWSGTGTTGATVVIRTEGGRVVNERPIIVDQNGNWTGSGNLSVLPGYKLTFTYTPLNGEPTVTDYLINVTP